MFCWSVQPIVTIEMCLLSKILCSDFSSFNVSF